jgi:hypothetical protein
MARKSRRNRKTRRSGATKKRLGPHVPAGYDASWDLDDSGDAFDRKHDEWSERDWMPWLEEKLTFPFETIREDGGAEDLRHFFGVGPRPKHFAEGSRITVLGFSDGGSDPDFVGVFVNARQGDHRGVVPLQDLEVRHKDDPNYWPVREFAVWYANR